MVQLRGRSQKVLFTVGRPEPEHEEEGRGRRLAEDIDTAEPAFHHILRAATNLSRFGLDVTDPALLARVVQVGRENYESDQRLTQLRAERAAVRDGALTIASKSSVVYYMRICNRVKIGYTTNLVSRLSSINPEELLVVEPGDRAKEAMRHQEFGHLRVDGEWFRLKGSLLVHVQHLRTGNSVTAQNHEGSRQGESQDAQLPPGTDYSSD
jgi:hypothetical protein